MEDPSHFLNGFYHEFSLQWNLPEMSSFACSCLDVCSDYAMALLHSFGDHSY